MTPFSNGTSAMIWYDENCTRCKRAFFPKKDGDYPSDATMKKYCSTGKECKLKYAIGFGFFGGTNLSLSSSERNYEPKRKLIYNKQILK